MAKTVATPEIHQALGVELFNSTWNLIEMADRPPEKTREMIDCAHASLYHWRQVGTQLNIQRGEWIIARVYSIAAIGGSSRMAAAACDHAEACLEITMREGIGGFDLAFAYEAVARASAAAGDQENALDHYRKARSAGQEIEGPDDREYFFTDLRGGEWFGLDTSSAEQA